MSVIPSLGSVILPGDFIVFKSGEGVEVCQLKRSLSSLLVEVVVWIEAVDAPPLCSRTYDNLVRSKVKELVVGTQTRINSNDIIDIAFVFSPDALEHYWPDVAGMKRMYFTRVHGHVPFSPIIVDSYPSRIWFSLICIKNLVRKILSRKQQYQICKGSCSTIFSLEAWMYLCLHFTPIRFQKRQTRIFQCSHLSLQSKSSIRELSMIRLMSPESMNVARDIFGNTFAIGTRNHPPHKDMPRKVLEAGHVMNVVNVFDYIGEPMSKELIHFQRIDLLYEQVMRILTIRVKYSACNAEDAIVSRILGFALAVPQNTIVHNRPQRVRKKIPVDTTFVFNDKYYMVNMSDGLVVSALCVDDGDEIRLTNDELWDIILGL